MAIYAVFGIDVGNLRRAPRRPMPEWVEMLNRYFLTGSPSLRILDFFGHTGNFLADSPSTDLPEVAARFGHLFDTDWVVCPIDDARAALTALADGPQPQREDGIRWTPGLVFHGGPDIGEGNIPTTSRAILWKISPRVIGALKRDNLVATGILDRERRGGGWGNISTDIRACFGGLWTARSQRTVTGLVRKAPL